MSFAARYSVLIGLVLLLAGAVICRAQVENYGGEIFIKEVQWLADRPDFLEVAFAGHIDGERGGTWMKEVGGLAVGRPPKMPDADWERLVAQFQSAKGKTAEIKMVWDNGPVAVRGGWARISAANVVSVAVK